MGSVAGKSDLGVQLYPLPAMRATSSRTNLYLVGIEKDWQLSAALSCRSKAEDVAVLAVDADKYN